MLAAQVPHNLTYGHPPSHQRYYICIMIKVAIFASGTGSNALNIIRHFADHPLISIACVISNKATAPIVLSAQQLGVSVLVYSNQEVEDGAFITSVCRAHGIEWIVLAGYLRLVPGELIEAYPQRIINLHPSLLPKYGGKGMYGRKVHEAVLANREQESGITIHYVNEAFDEGEIIAQFKCNLAQSDGLPELEGKIRNLEQAHLPQVIEEVIRHATSPA